MHRATGISRNRENAQAADRNSGEVAPVAATGTSVAEDYAVAEALAFGNCCVSA